MRLVPVRVSRPSALPCPLPPLPAAPWPWTRENAHTGKGRRGDERSKRSARRSGRLGRESGTFVEPSSAAAWAGSLKRPAERGPVRGSGCPSDRRRVQGRGGSRRSSFQCPSPAQRTWPTRGDCWKPAMPAGRAGSGRDIAPTASCHHPAFAHGFGPAVDLRLYPLHQALHVGPPGFPERRSEGRGSRLPLRAPTTHSRWKTS